MSTLAEFMILSSADNRPPMLEKHMYDSWKSRMELYMQNREHGRMILESVEYGPLIWPTIEENGVTRTKKYEELVAKDLWEIVQLLMQGTSLTKHERECKLYDAFNKFAHIKRESLHQYYFRFTQLINDMNIYKMKLEQLQVNTKFLNSLPPEWSKFVTDVKLVRDLHTTNFNQLHAYLEQHELHANEVRIMRECNQDLLALGKQSSFATGTSGTRANISGIGRNNSGQQRVVKCFNCQGEGHMARQCPKPKRKREATWFRDKVLLVEAQRSGKVLNEEELEFLADPGVVEDKAVLMANLSSYGSDVLFEVPHSKITHNDMLNQSVHEMQYSEQTHLVNYPENELTSERDIIPYSQCLLETQNAAVQDTNSSAQQDAMILSVFEQLSNQVTNCNKVNKDNLIANESLYVELERYKERVKFLEERQNVDLSTREKLIMDDIIQDKNAQFADFEKEINYFKQTLSDQSKEKELLTKTFNFFKNESKEKEAKNIDKKIALEKKVKELDNIKAQQIRPMLYDGSVIAKETNVISIADFEETLMLEEESRSKMLLKQSDPMVLEKKVNIKPTIYSELNRLSEYFAELQAKDIKIKKLKTNIKRLNKTSTTNNVKRDIDEIETINIELEHRVAKLIAKNEHLKQTYKQRYDSIKPSRIRSKEHVESLVNQLNQKSVEITNLNAQLQEKVFVITSLKNDLWKFKVKDIVDKAAQVSNATTIAPGMYKLDLVTLAPKNKNNRETHIYYLKHIMKQAAILREIV
ncbi:retrovirus-related pol polyprotein from transposon TNT 1-94 [Tanacetum coccineum]